jgi:hypothetical protein
MLFHSSSIFCLESIPTEVVDAMHQFGIDAARRAFVEAADRMGFYGENLNGLSASQFREVFT